MRLRHSLMIFALVFATRFGYFIHARPYRMDPDGSYGRMYEMEASADRLAREGRLADAFGEGSGPSAHVAPIYAGYLAVLDRLSGLDVGRFRFAHGLGAVVATSLFAALLPILGARAGLRPGVGTAAGLLVAASPFGLWMEIRGDWETAFLPLALAATSWALMALRDRPGDRLAAATGVLFGLGGLLSPVVLLAGLAGLAGLVIPAILGRDRALRRVRDGVIVLAACGATVTPWVYRNYRCFGAFVPIRDNFGIELAVGNNADSDGTTFGGGISAHPLSNPAELAALRARGEVPYNKQKQREASAWIAAHPARFARLTADRLACYWFPHDRRMLGPMPLLPVAVQALALGAATALAIGGLAWLFLAGHPYRYLFLAVLVAPSLPYLVTHVSYRYRYPINGFVYLLACECLARAYAARGRPVPV